MAHSPARIDPMYAAIDVTGDAWSWLIIRDVVLLDIHRFNELQRHLGIGRETLSHRLDRLVRNGILTKESASTGQAVHYLATERGADLFDCLIAGIQWGRDWCSEPGNPALDMTHQSCGHPFEGQYRCGRCDGAVLAREVAASSGSVAHLTGREGRTRAPDLAQLEHGDPSPLARTLRIIGDRWASLIVRECFFGARRFADFRSRLGIATNTLTARLNRLVESGVLHRVPYSDRPRYYEYRFTEKGLAMYPIPLAMLAWGSRWVGDATAPVELEHKPCGNPLHPVMTCVACGNRARLEDISVLPAASRVPPRASVS